VKLNTRSLTKSNSIRQSDLCHCFGYSDRSWTLFHLLIRVNDTIACVYDRSSMVSWTYDVDIINNLTKHT